MATMPEQRPETARNALVRMLRRCADYLETLPADEADAFLQGQLDLRLALTARKAPPRRKSHPPLQRAELEEVAEKLRLFSTREEGEELLNEVAPTKAILEDLARYLDVTVRKDDRAEELVRRIIQSMIGYRLGSAAIQGRQLAKGEKRE